ncbi:MAG: hypothetical protein KDJ99_02350 [Candidatus Competibacteraceae bacterium]|nr:hypothetical protein [Candidatus Competibacteraceae bacterium]
MLLPLKPRLLILLGLLLLQTLQPVLANSNIDPANRFVWSEIVGWLNFSPGSNGVEVTPTHLRGYAWGENIGWVKFGADSGGPYANTNADNWGVNRALTGELSGFAWSENVGWISFNSTTINPLNGEFEGFGWSENIGWIHLQSEDGSYGVSTEFTVLPTGPTGPTAIPTLSNLMIAVLALLLLTMLLFHHSKREEKTF